MIKPDIDQFTLVLQSIDVFSFDEWREWVANNLINSFLIKSKMLTLFDNFGKSDVKLPEGYTEGYSFINAPFYFCIAYHEAFSKMGVIVKFSAYAWHEYRKRYEEYYNEPIHLHTFFKLIDSNEYTFRLSRIDVCCDFFNEGINIAKLKRSIEDGRTELRYGKY
ncbi:hypothetical protein CHH49_16920 [Terribacillus saccharophilus]|uniref:hypothetical protein n=1 Tax=Terribacillus saccharophilus TaxID=361277 RepID=UPI000BA5F977|nr:hypothetical protein [Terribacillus saccharophilus]PAF20324.1 hypothetical protein CHH49_16920 [Terribacillus saccharophilus]